MKTIHFLSAAFIRSVIITGLIFASMAFQKPLNSESQKNFIQAKDTIPQNEMNINIDVDKILAEVDKSLAKIDFDKISKQVDESLQKIDFTKIQKEIDASLTNTQ
jgi:hypothetical protein